MTAADFAALEGMKPVPVRVGNGWRGRLLFALRCAGDLQLETIRRFLVPYLRQFDGDVLDVGCGHMPFRTLMPDGVRYTGLDVPQADSFGMPSDRRIVVFDGRAIPFPDASFDWLLCTEVLEHAEDPVLLIAEMRRVVRPGGRLILTVPFSARVHHRPFDYFRFTRHQLSRMFASFGTVAIEERGNDLCVIANKLILVVMRLMRPAPALLWRFPIAALLAPVATALLVVAHASLAFGWGSKDDPLGYAVAATR